MSLVNTLMQSLRSEYTAKLDKNEVRASRYGVWDLFKKDSGLASGIFDAETYANIKNSFGNTVNVPVLDTEAVSIGNVRSCTIADSENVSQLVTLTFATLSFGFTMTPSQHKNNDLKYQADFDRKLKKYLVALAATLDNSGITELEASKNQHWTGVAPTYYAEIADALQVLDADKEDFYNQMQAIMDTMDFYQPVNVAVSPSHNALVRSVEAQGGGNAVNTNFQFDPYTWYTSNRIANGAGVRSTGYMVEEGSLAFATRVDPDAEFGHKIGEVAEWSTVNMPIPGSVNSLEMGAYYTKDCADRSAMHAGLGRTLREGFEFSVDVMYQSAYNSAIGTRFSPIVKFEQTVA